MTASWISRSDASELRVANPANRTGMDADARELIFDLVNDPLFQDPDKTKVALVLKDLLQERMTHRVRTRDLPTDDPNRDTDPARGEREFWEGNGINREVVTRETIVISVVWDGERFIPDLRPAVG